MPRTRTPNVPRRRLNRDVETLICAEAAAARLGKTRRYICWAVNAGHLPCVEVIGSDAILIALADLNDYARALAIRQLGKTLTATEVNAVLTGKATLATG
jgi:hypothetical protein